MKFELPGLDTSAWPDVNVDDKVAATASVGVWYHTIDFGDGHVTKGVYDMRQHVEDYRLPDLQGLEVLDVGASNGFFTFELERRGANVTAVDLPSYRFHDYPQATLEKKLAGLSDAELSGFDWNQLHGGFLVAHHLLGSKAKRVLTPIYDMPKVLEPRYDIVFCSTVLVHLRDPVGALEAIRAVVKPGGMAIVATPTHAKDVGDVAGATFIGYADGPAWWMPAPRTFVDWHKVVGFEHVEIVSQNEVFRVGGDGFADPVAVVHARK